MYLKMFTLTGEGSLLSWLFQRTSSIREDVDTGDGCHCPFEPH